MSTPLFMTSFRSALFQRQMAVGKINMWSKAKRNKRYTENCNFPLISPSWKPSPREQMKCLLLQQRRKSGEMSHVSWFLQDAKYHVCESDRHTSSPGVDYLYETGHAVPLQATPSTSTSLWLQTRAMNLYLSHLQGWEGTLVTLLWWRKKM